MEKIYYSPKGFWKGHSAVSKLAKEAKVSQKQLKPIIQSNECTLAHSLHKIKHSICELNYLRGNYSPKKSAQRIA